MKKIFGSILLGFLLLSGINLETYAYWGGYHGGYRSGYGYHGYYAGYYHPYYNRVYVVPVAYPTYPLGYTPVWIPSQWTPYGWVPGHWSN